MHHVLGRFEALGDQQLDRVGGLLFVGEDIRCLSPGRAPGHLIAVTPREIWETRDGGAHWQAKRDGLPQNTCFFTVLRQGMATDRATPAGVYFGTNTGSVFASTDEGESWDEIARHLPAVLAVEVLQR